MTLLAPLFLAGLLGILLPWWLHRLSMDNPPTQEFASTLLMERSDTLSSQQTRLRYRLLFALRALLIALLALLFAQPALNKITQLTGTPSKRVVIVLDVSFSQNLTGRWQRSQQIAADLLNDLGGADQAVVVAAAANIRQLRGDYSITAARSAIKSLSPELGRLDYGRIGNALAPIIKASKLPVEVHIVSDLQASAMPERFAALAIDGVALTQLHNSASATDRNLSLSGKLDRLNGTKADITSVVVNNSDRPQTIKLHLLAAGKTLATASVQSAAGASVLQQFRAVDIGTAKRSVEIQMVDVDDDLAADNRATIALPTDQVAQISVLRASQNSSASLYASAALEADPRFASHAIETSAISIAGAGSLLIIADAAVLADADVAKLQNYLADGGNVLLIAGSRTHSVSMRRLLNRREQQPANPSRDGSSSIAHMDASHELISDLQSHWRALTIARHLKLATSSADRVLISLQDDAPLLLEREVASGKLMILASALDSDWNNLAVSPLFVAFILRSVEYLSNDLALNPQQWIGERLRVNGGTQVLDPEGRALRDMASLSQQTSVALDMAGIYTVENNLGSRFLAVGPDPRESNIANLDADTVSRWQNAGNSVRDGAVSEANQHPTSPAGNLHLWLLLLLALLAFTEALYSHRHLWIRREV